MLRRSLVRPLRMAASYTTNEASVLFSENGGVCTATLNRPKALNALNLDMISLMMPKYQEWEQNPNVKCILLRGAGEKAFCAGGDIKAIAAGGKQGGVKAGEFFHNEYNLDHLIGTLSTPHVSLIDGITMGGGVGLSVHAPFQVATERTVFAMPETGIGLFPDVGGSHFLPRLPGALGMYLALTGHRLKGADVVHAGIASHYSPSGNLVNVVSQLVQASRETTMDVGGVLSSATPASADLPPFSLEAQLSDINDCFAGDSLDEILAKLREKNNDWSYKTLQTLGRMSPTSLKITFRQLKEGAALSLADCLKMEYRLGTAVLAHSDFYEGVRAVLTDKDNNPKWNPATLEEVTDELVDAYFQNLPSTFSDAPELVLNPRSASL